MHAYRGEFESFQISISMTCLPFSVGDAARSLVAASALALFAYISFFRGRLIQEYVLLMPSLLLTVFICLLSRSFLLYP